MYYKGISGEPGFHTCPYGFSSYIGNEAGNELIYTGLKIKGHFDKSKLKIRTQEDFLPVIPEDVFQKSIQNTHLVLAEIQDSATELEKFKQKDNDNREFLNFIVHEIRKLNAQIKRCSEELSKELEKGQNANNEFLVYRVNNIFGSSSLVSVRLDAYDFGQNPELITSAVKALVGIYKKFDKVKHCLSVMALQKRVDIAFSGQSFFESEVYQVFDILPFLLFENAIKYSPKNQTITTQFTEHSDALQIVIESIGPHVPKDEQTRLCEPRFRGKHAIEFEKSGTGYGLYLAKLICDIHKVDLKIESEQNITKIDGVPFSKFRVTLTFECSTYKTKNPIFNLH